MGLGQGIHKITLVAQGKLVCRAAVPVRQMLRGAGLQCGPRSRGKLPGFPEAPGGGKGICALGRMVLVAEKG